MKMTPIAALAAALLSAPTFAAEPAPVAATTPTKADRAGKAEAKPDAKKADPKQTDPKKAAGAAQKPAPKSGEAAPKEPPCEPVKPCPIE